MVIQALSGPPETGIPYSVGFSRLGVITAKEDPHAHEKEASSQ
jgi:hypothetical protein